MYLIFLLTVINFAKVITEKITLKQLPDGSRRFVDSNNRERFFHGVNAVVKGPPWIPATDYWDGDISLNEKDLDDLQSLGMNVIRLGENSKIFYLNNNVNNLNHNGIIVGRHRQRITPKLIPTQNAWEYNSRINSRIRN